MAEFKVPTETVELPSKGLIYPANSPLSSGTIELKYMTAKEEDILTNANYIRSGVAIDKLLKSLIVDKSINYDDLLTGDKNAIMIAARILSYGKDYEIKYDDQDMTIDLSKIESKPLKENLYERGKNEFEFTLPQSQNTVTFQLLSSKVEGLIDRELEGLKKVNKTESPEITTRLKYMITSVNGSRETVDIRNFVDNYLLASDARALRQYYNEINPDVNLTFMRELPEGGEEVTPIPIGVTFFWPDVRL
jgi:hypothetical protein